MIIPVGSRTASVLDDEPTALFGAERVIRESLPGPANGNPLHPARAVVEVIRHGGGLMPRALLGGAYGPDGQGELVIDVPTSGASLDGTPSCTSRLSRALVPGLPDEFAQSVVGGLVRRALPNGRTVIDRAAFDPTDSSPLAFELAAELLAGVIYAMSAELDVERAAHDAIEAWP